MLYGLFQKFIRFDDLFRDTLWSEIDLQASSGEVNVMLCMCVLCVTLSLYWGKCLPVLHVTGRFILGQVLSCVFCLTGRVIYILGWMSTLSCGFCLTGRVILVHVSTISCLLFDRSSHTGMSVYLKLCVLFDRSSHTGMSAWLCLVNLKTGTPTTT